MGETANIPQEHRLVVVCIEDHPKAIILLRAACKKAREMGCKWRAVYVETPSHTGAGDDSVREHMLKLLTLASQMGGEVVQLEADTVEDGLIKVLEEEKSRLALCIVGSDDSEGGWRWWRTSSRHRLVDRAKSYAEVETIPLAGEPFAGYRWFMPSWPDLRLRHLAYALLSVAVAYLCAALLKWALPPALFRINDGNIAMLFMIACAFTASRYGLVPGLLASLAGYAALNYYFIAPFYSIEVTTVTDTLNMALFLSAAVLISLFTSQTRGRAKQSAKRELGTQVLFSLYRVAANSFTRQQALEKLQGRLTQLLDMEVAFFLPPVLNPDRIEPAYPPDLKLDEKARHALDICWSEIKATGRASPFDPGTGWRFEPMLAMSGEIGVLGVCPHKGQRLDPWYGQLLAAVADQTAAVLEHIELERSMEATRLREEREKLRSMLLSSVSHDLKTPLSGIIGALSVHMTLGERLAVERRHELLETALEEAHRLDNFISNILDMTKLESGKLEFRQEWHGVAEMIQRVIKLLQHPLRKHEVVVHPAPQGLEAYMDPMMTEQVLQNLLDNAAKYTRAGTRIEISCRTEDEWLLIEVRDHGKGLPADKLQRVFDKYARLQKEDSQVAGTGLGLAISKAVMEAQGGSISAANHPGGGAVFVFRLPKWRKLAKIDKKHVA